METGTILGGFSLAVAALTAWNSLRKTNIEDRTGAVADLQKVVETLRTEIVRNEQKYAAADQEHQKEITELRQDVNEAKTACQEQIVSLQLQLRTAERTIIKQANRITELEKQIPNAVGD